MKLEFTKMHGTGNDYIYFNCLSGELTDPSRLAREMCPRHTSVGADGIAMICRSSVADAKMRMFNADGSEAEMCGNAIRCVGKYLYDSGIAIKNEMDIETLSGVKHLYLHTSGGKADRVTVDMGYADISQPALGIFPDTSKIVSPLFVMGREWRVTCVSMGNPHVVVFLDEDIDLLNLERIGPHFERHPIFPERVNTEFLNICERNLLKMRVYERGSGETYACGTGACAAAVAAALCGRADFGEDIKVILKGGEISVRVMPDMKVYMSGGAVTVYKGEYDCTWL